jgi:D-alanyl-D-alanine carboxypeptidase (penicillin-binding protein 5/6)
MMNIMKKRSMRRIFAGILCMGVLFTGAVPCSASAPLGYDEYGDPIVTATPVPDSQAGQSTQAAVTHSAYYAQAADTDSIDGWPTGPSIEAQAAVLMDVNTEAVLYSKNGDTQLYPASITKIMTSLLACENISKKSSIVVSESAATSVSAGDSSIYAAAGEKFTRDQALMAVMLQSANEMSVAVAEKVSGSVKKFTELMNWRAKLFGCKNTHFNNPNGLPDENHYTTASDMAKIAKSAWMNPLYRKFCTRRYYEIPPTNKFPEARQLLNHHKMIKNGEYYYEGVLGGKTGYTDASGNTLVTYCRRGNTTLVAVILNSTSAANAYGDTASLFDYGFGNFEKTDMKVSMEPVPFKVLPCDKYILKNNGNTYPFYYKTKVYVTLPKGIDKSQLTKRQAVLQNAAGPLRLKSKYYYKKQMVGWGMQYERNVVSDLLVQAS